MAKGLQSWTVRESSAPITSAEIKTATSGTAVSFSQATRGMIGVVVPANTEDLTLTLRSDETIVIPGAAVAAMFAPGAILPFSCKSFVFGGTETAFKVIGYF